MKAKYHRIQIMLLLLFVGLLTLSQAALADDLQPPQPNTVNRNFRIFVSSPDSGSIGSLQYADEDILSYDTQTRQWVKSFDGTNAGLPGSTDIDALAYTAINLGYIYYMSFESPTVVPGLGTVDDSDIVAYRYVFGQNGTWSLYFRGSQNGLTTDSEDIDAIDVEGNQLYISTLGNFKVPKLGGGNLTGTRDDVIVYILSTNSYMLRVDGSAIGMASSNNVRGYAYVRYDDYDWHFLSLKERADLKDVNAAYPSVRVKANDIGVYEQPSNGKPKAFGTVWSASGAGFPKVDAIDLVLK